MPHDKNKERLTVREACRRRMPLDGADAQALEHALTITEGERDDAISKRDGLLITMRMAIAQGVAESEKLRAQLEEYEKKSTALLKDLDDLNRENHQWIDEVTKLHQGLASTATADQRISAALKHLTGDHTCRSDYECRGAIHQALTK